jgi:phage gp45-like
MMTTSRATLREVDDNNLMQSIKYADVHHSETPSDFERFQHLGTSAVPLKQDEQSQQQGGGQGQQGGGQGLGGGGGGDFGAGGVDQPNFNENQPKGKAAEAVIQYVGSNRAHPVATVVDDRRTRPYGMKEGEGANYSPDGSGQMLLHTKDAAYLLTRDGKSYRKDSDNQQRSVSIRHVDKQYQERKIQKQQGGQQGGGNGQQQNQEQDHIGKLNMGVTFTKDRTEFRVKDGSKDGKVWAYYDASDNKFHLLVETVHHKDVRVGENASKPARMQGYNFADTTDARLLLTPGSSDLT